MEIFSCLITHLRILFLTVQPKSSQNMEIKKYKNTQPFCTFFFLCQVSAESLREATYRSIFKLTKELEHLFYEKQKWLRAWLHGEFQPGLNFQPG